MTEQASQADDTALVLDLTGVPTVELYGVLTSARLLAKLTERPEIQDADLARRLRVWEAAISAELALRPRKDERS